MQAELPLFSPDAGTAVGATVGEPRRVVLGDRIVHYTLRRARRRTIGLTIDQRGLRVGAPLRAPLAEIEALLHKHAAWVLDKLDGWRTRPAGEVRWLSDGIDFPLLGAAARLRLRSGADTYSWPEPDAADGGRAVLELCCRSAASVPTVFERALRERALAVFLSRTQNCCERYGIVLPALRLSAARTRWGSCSRLSGVRLNWRLVHASTDLIDYVIAHELAHLREMNHSPAFWSEVGRLFPDWRGARRRLREFGAGLPRFVGTP